MLAMIISGRHFVWPSHPPFIATCSFKGKTTGTGIVVNGGVHRAVQALAGLP